MTLRSRLAVGLVTISIILVGPLVFAIQSLYGLRDDARALRDREFAASQLLGRLREGLNDLRREELALLFAKTTASRDTMEQQVARVAALADSLKPYVELHFANIATVGWFEGAMITYPPSPRVSISTVLSARLASFVLPLISGQRYSQCMPPPGDTSS